MPVKTVGSWPGVPREKVRASFWWRWRKCVHIEAWTHIDYFQSPTREWAKWVSEPVKRASEQNEWSEAERCRASERSERCERTNVASDWVPRSKRNCLWLETPPWSSILSYNTSILLLICILLLTCTKPINTVFACQRLYQRPLIMSVGQLEERVNLKWKETRISAPA